MKLERIVMPAFFAVIGLIIAQAEVRDAIKARTSEGYYRATGGIVKKAEPGKEVPYSELITLPLSGLAIGYGFARLDEAGWLGSGGGIGKP